MTMSARFFYFKQCIVNGYGKVWSETARLEKNDYENSRNKKTAIKRD
jgi:hypothetical protein